MAIWIWVGLFIVLFFVGAILVLIQNYIKRIKREEEEKAELRLKAQEDLLLNSILVQEKERARIAADLHDNLASRLQLIRLSNNTGESKESMNTYLQESMQVARRISHDLSPPMLEESRLSILLSDYLQPLKVKFQVSFHVKEEKGIQLENTVKLQVLRIFQEVINNCIKHAEASVIKVLLRVNARYFAISIADNGIGSSNISSQGMGVKNIETRSRLLKGKYRLRSTVGKGTQFLLIVPLTHSKSYE